MYIIIIVKKSVDLNNRSLTSNKLKKIIYAYICTYLNTTVKYRFIFQDKHYLCLMASDTPDQNLTQYFPLCNDFIHAARLRDGNVLIHW